MFVGLSKKNSGDTSLCHRYFRFMDYTKKATDYLLVVFLVVVFLAVAVIAGFAA